MVSVKDFIFSGHRPNIHKMSIFVLEINVTEECEHGYEAQA